MICLLLVQAREVLHPLLQKRVDDARDQRFLKFVCFDRDLCGGEGAGRGEGGGMHGIWFFFFVLILLSGLHHANGLSAFDFGSYPMNVVTNLHVSM